MSLCLAVYLSFCVSGTALANSTETNVNRYQINESIIEQKQIAQINKEVSRQISNYNEIVKYSSINSHDWKVEYGKSKKVKFSGYASGQPLKGTRFKTGGGFYYSPNGGSSLSIGISFPAPFLKMSISASLGRSVGNSNYGKFVNVPSNKYYYKLYVEKVYLLKPYITYHKVNGKNIVRGIIKKLLG